MCGHRTLKRNARWCCISIQMSRLMTKPPKWPLRPAKTQISLGIRQHPPSLIRLFAVRMKKHLGPQLPIERTAKTLISLGGWPGWPESSLGYTVLPYIQSMGVKRTPWTSLLAIIANIYTSQNMDQLGRVLRCFSSLELKAHMWACSTGRHQSSVCRQHFQTTYSIYGPWERIILVAVAIDL